MPKHKKFKSFGGWTVSFTWDELMEQLEEALLHCNQWNHVKQGHAVQVAKDLLTKHKRTVWS